MELPFLLIDLCVTLQYCIINTLLYNEYSDAPHFLKKCIHSNLLRVVLDQAESDVEL